MNTRVLVCDDDPSLREVVKYTFEREGWAVNEASNGLEALDQLARESFDIVVLDVAMPELDGLSTCRELRKTSDVPVIFLTARDTEIDRILGLEIGGDDYLTKPFSPRELASRVRAILRRSRPRDEETVIKSGPLKMDIRAHRCWVEDTEVIFTASEFQLLKILVQQPDVAWPRTELMKQALDHHVSERTIDSHMRRIRKKLKDAGADPVETVHGVGYRLKVL